MKPSWNLLGVVVVVVVTGVVVQRARGAVRPRAARTATVSDRARFATSVASQEHEWRDKAAEDFPHDHWSQRDAFHGHEALVVRSLASKAGVAYEAVLGAIDEDLHRHGGAGRNAEVVPCKPRPVFE